MKHTQCEKILIWMLDKTEWKVKDFQRDPYFLGYEAGTRVGDLERSGNVERIRMEGKFAIYRLTESGLALAMGIRFVNKRYRNKRKSEIIEVGIYDRPLSKQEGTDLYNGKPIKAKRTFFRRLVDKIF